MIDYVDNFCVGLGGNANATLSVSGNISGKVSSPNIPLYQTGIPGLNYDGYVAASSTPHTMDGSSPLMAESLILVPNLCYSAALTPNSQSKMSARPSKRITSLVVPPSFRRPKQDLR